MKGVRLGRLNSAQVNDAEQEIFDVIGNVHVVDALGESSFLNHGYFHDNPAASSDLIRLIRLQSKPGDPLRPLKHEKNNFWSILKNYPADQNLN